MTIVRIVIFNNFFLTINKEPGRIFGALGVEAIVVM